MSELWMKMLELNFIIKLLNVIIKNKDEKIKKLLLKNKIISNDIANSYED